MYETHKTYSYSAIAHTPSEGAAGGVGGTGGAGGAGGAGAEGAGAGGLPSVWSWEVEIVDAESTEGMSASMAVKKMQI